MSNSNKLFYLRKAELIDEKLLFKWANDKHVRKWSFNRTLISLEEHNTWFINKINNSNVLMWIFMYNNKPAGTVRLEKKNNEVVLNYLIASESRGEGLASKMLKMAIIEVENYWHNIKIFAYTFPKNIASIKSLKKAGFSSHFSTDEKYCFTINI